MEKLIQAALLKLVKEYLLSDENIAKARDYLKAKLIEWKDSTETEWDDQAVDAFLKFVGW